MALLLLTGATRHLQRGRGQAHGDLQHHLEHVSQLAGVSQTRTIEALTAEEVKITNPAVAGGRGSAFNLYKRGP